MCLNIVILEFQCFQTIYRYKKFINFYLNYRDYHILFLLLRYIYKTIFANITNTQHILWIFSHIFIFYIFIFYEFSQSKIIYLLFLKYINIFNIIKFIFIRFIYAIDEVGFVYAIDKFTNWDNFQLFGQCSVSKWKWMPLSKALGNLMQLLMITCCITCHLILCIN